VAEGRIYQRVLFATRRATNTPGNVKHVKRGLVSQVTLNIVAKNYEQNFAPLELNVTDIVKYLPAPYTKDNPEKIYYEITLLLNVH
jgi:hypothetical protein